jgi:hypothetical protein
LTHDHNSLGHGLGHAFRRGRREEIPPVVGLMTNDVDRQIAGNGMVIMRGQGAGR